MNTDRTFYPRSIRAYTSDDAESTLWIFHEAITVTASADYSPEQIAAWARPRDLAAWDVSMRRRKSHVALVEGQVVGFSDVSDEGYIDMLYVAPEFAHRGVGRALIKFLEDQARRSGARQLTANVSITARAFFEAVGFTIEAEQHPVIHDVVLTNFRMVKSLESRG